MTSTITPHTTSPCFQLKGSMVTMMTLELYRFDEAALHQQFQGLLAKAPRFFENTPVVVGLEHLHNPEGAVDLTRLCTLCAGFGINLIAIRGGNRQHRCSASEAGLACLSAQPQAAARQLPISAKQATHSGTAATLRSTKVTPIHQTELALKSTTDEPADTASSNTASAPQASGYLSPRIISTPVRSGQQVYYDGDLILTGPVSPGAEILASGNIHAYGAFRGRALAGVNGNTQARIYCTHFEAELVSIHGHYKLATTAEKPLWKQAAQVFLENDTLILKPL